MYKFDYKKNLGQNFLQDKNIIDKIVNAPDYGDNNLVIEIGPGAGALTKELLKKVDRAILYEVDTRLEKILNKELSTFVNYELIFDDFLNRDVNKDISKYDFDNLYIVANLPYYITTPIITKIINDKIPINEIVIMIQKEVADRFSAKPGSKEYGQITVFLNYFFDIDNVCNVSKNCFFPKPKVDSAVIKMKRKESNDYIKNFDVFNKLVKDSFRFKRKTIKNNLVGYDLDIISNILTKYGFDINTRSENIPYNVFVEIANELC
ncbi:MAG: 16S rRNA (adenine(1518)-N(6)/adenine(1519)-N(6))-dimethyltransferase RsmA [Bacilli bacterium]|nr:16S rRNA (adenine(1518)-N(6)/adenine(1519)-N(6))-dimethyltransferase RsmA [Bacilli bacterium]MDY5996175.1 16S rRNA (adenine(1518)-N(6)/adenine(1519)-N(6))-dimethyltransferase RsmA [Bacilli bacterium]